MNQLVLVEFRLMSLPRIRTLKMIPAILWLVVCPGLLAFSLFTERFNAGLWWELYFLAVTILSPLAFVAFGWDKWRAKRETTRIPEKTLHLLAALGGWPGAAVGQQWFRHKTVKPVFRAILIAICVLHIVGVSALLWFDWHSA